MCGKPAACGTQGGAHTHQHTQALWALVYNNQKAKAMVKTQHVTLGGRTMSILAWIVLQHDLLQHELAADENDGASPVIPANSAKPRMPCTNTGDSQATHQAQGSVGPIHEYTSEALLAAVDQAMRSEGGMRVGGHAVLTRALESLRAALALTLD